MVSDVYFPRINGVSTALQTLRRELAHGGHDVTLIAPDYGACQEADPHPGTVFRIRSRTVWGDPEDRMMAYRGLRDLLPELARGRFDLVHVHTPFVAHYGGRFLARRLGLPLVETYHTFFEEYLFHYVPVAPPALMRYLARAFSRSQCRDVDALVVPSRPMLQRLRHYGVGTPAAVIPTGIEPADFAHGDGARFRSRHGIEADRPVLLYVGRVAHEKNIGFLLAVLERVRLTQPAALLVIAGEGPATATLRRETQARGLAEHVRFVGYLDRRHALPDCYHAADLFVFASRTETQGLVLLEAMAAGLPVVALAVMGTADVLVEGEGASIARDDVADFAARVSALLADPARRRELGARARAYAQGWTAQEMTARLAAFYEQVLAASQGQAREASGLSRTGCPEAAAARAAPRR